MLVFSSFLLTLLGVAFGFVGEADRRDVLEGELCRVERVDADGPFGVASFSGDIERRTAPLVVTISCYDAEKDGGVVVERNRRLAQRQSKVLGGRESAMLE